MRMRERILTGAALLLVTLALMPLFLMESPWPTAARDYLAAHGQEESGADNLVSAIYLGYRVFDTLGETIVLVLAVTGTIAVINRQKAAEVKEGRTGAAGTEGDTDLSGGRGASRKRRTVLMEVVAGKLAPVVLIFGLYVMFYGHVSPGGGFQGGVVVASGLIFLFLGTRSRITNVLARGEVLARLEALGFMLFVSASLLGLAAGGGFFANPLPSWGLPAEGFIILLNVVIGMKVGAGIAYMCVEMMADREAAHGDD